MLIESVKDILFNPKATWIKIKDEPGGFAHVLTSYAVPLTVIPAFFGMLGYSFVGIRSGFSHIVYRIPFHMAFLWALVYYVLTLIGLYLVGIIINALAPSFNSKQNAVNAFKVAVYAYTPAFVAGVLYIEPTSGMLVFLLSLYGVYLLFLGLPVMMETPKEKVMGYLIVVIIVVIVVYAIIGGISGAILSATWRPVL